MIYMFWYAPSRMPVPSRRGGFTLIELLITIAIMAILMAALMPLITIANRAARRSATISVMTKLDVAVRLFRADIGSYPYQRTYAATGTPAINQLYWNIGTNLTTAQTASITADAAFAAGRYAINDVPPNDFSFRVAAWPQSTSLEGIYGASQARILNRMAAERARMGILAGNVDIKGPQPIPHPGFNYYAYMLELTPRALPTGNLVPTASLSSVAPYGWANDYLTGELEQRYRSGYTVLDAWGQPLTYVCQVVEGVYSAPILAGCTYYNAQDWGLQTQGRTTLAANDALTGQPTGFNLSALLHSDRRTTAAPKLEAEFELWSAGPDGRFDWMRDASSFPGDVNYDNISPLPYDKGLQ